MTIKQDDDRGSVRRHVISRQRQYSYRFTSKEILDLYVSSPEFKKKIDNGKYVFVEGRLVLNSDLCLIYEDGRVRIKEDALANPEQFFLHSQEVPAGGNSARIHIRCSGRRRHGYPTTPWGKPVLGYRTRRTWKTEYTDAEYVSSVYKITPENLSSFSAFGDDDRESFAAALIRLMNRPDNTVTEEQLAERTGLSVKTIQRMRNPEERPSMASVIAVCIALGLAFWDSEQLLARAGYTLTNRKADKVYRALLIVAEERSVYDCNRVLEKFDLKPLTKL